MNAREIGKKLVGRWSYSEQALNIAVIQAALDDAWRAGRDQVTEVVRRAKGRATVVSPSALRVCEEIVDIARALEPPPPETR